MIRALAGAFLALILIGCSGSPPSDGGATQIPAGPGGAGQGGCEFAHSDDPEESLTLLVQQHKALVAELAEDLETAETLEERQEIYAAMATVDEACLEALRAIPFPAEVDSTLGLAVSALETLAASRRAAANAATEQEFDDAVTAQGSAQRGWDQWRNALLLDLPG